MLKSKPKQRNKPKIRTKEVNNFLISGRVDQKQYQRSSDTRFHANLFKIDKTVKTLKVKGVYPFVS